MNLSDYYYIFEYPSNTNYKIIFNDKDTNDLNFFQKNIVSKEPKTHVEAKKDNIIFKNFFKKYNQSKDKLSMLYKKYLNKKINENTKKEQDFIKNRTLRLYYQPYVSRLFFDYKNSGFLKLKDIDKSIDKSFILKTITSHYKYNDSIHDSNTKEKFNELFFRSTSSKLYLKLKDKEYCERVDIIFESQLKTIYQIYNFLNIGGIFVLKFQNGICANYIIECFYLMSLMFKKIIITHETEFVCFDFMGEKNIQKDQFKQIIKNSKNFTIYPKPELSSILNFILNIQQQYFQIEKFLFQNKLNLYTSKLYNNTLLSIYEVCPDSYLINNMTQNFIEFYQFKKTNLYISDLFSQFDKYKVQKLYKIINSNKPKLKNKNVLQIGFSYGSLTYNILNQNKKINITLLDPYQEEKFDNCGIEFLDSNKINKKRYNLYQSDIIEKLTEFNINKNKYAFIILSIDENFEKLSSYLIYLNNLLDKNGFIFINSFNTEYLKLIDFMNNNLNVYQNIYLINHNYYLFQI